MQVGSPLSEPSPVRGSLADSRLFQPPASSLQRPEPNRQLSGLESTLTPAISPRGSFLIATLLRFCPSRRFSSHSSAHDGTRPERFLLVGRSFSSGKMEAARSAYLCADPIAACTRSGNQSLFPEFLIDTACRLEINLTPAESTQMPFLIVAELRFCAPRQQPDFCADSLTFTAISALAEGEGVLGAFDGLAEAAPIVNLRSRPTASQYAARDAPKNGASSFAGVL